MANGSTRPLLPENERQRLSEAVEACAIPLTNLALFHIAAHWNAPKDRRPKEAVDARPYGLLVRHLIEDGADPKDLAQRIGYSVTTIRHLASGQKTWCHPELARAIDKMLQRMSR